MTDDDEIVDLVRDAGLDWHQGFAVGEDVNRYVTLVRAAIAAAAPPCPHIRSGGGPPGWVTNWCALGGAPAAPSADRVIDLLVAAGHVSQAKVDEARRIAAGLRWPHDSEGTPA
jgi:hypothetical protein